MPERLSAAIVVRRRVHPTGNYQLGRLEQMRAGLERHGIKVETVEPGVWPKAGFIVCWGVRNVTPYIEQGMPSLIMECGYVGDRLAWTSLGWNGLNGRADFCNKNVDGDRWCRLFANALSPWRHDGQYILLVGQVVGDNAVQHVDLRRWYASTAEALRERYDMPIMFRAHPKSPDDRVGGVPKANGSLEDALDGAALVVTFNSNVGVLAALAGVPVIAMDEGAMAYPVAGHDVDEVRRLDRTKWCSRLAWCQWSGDEIRSGAAWEHIRAGLA